MEADAESGPNDIELGDAHTYLLTIPGVGEDHARTGDLDVTGSVSINGHSTIDSGHRTLGADTQLFHVLSGTLVLDGPTLERGGVFVAPQAGLWMANATVRDGFAVNGGAVTSFGSTTIINSRLIDNTAVGDDDPAHMTSALGGAILAGDGTLTVTGSTIADNEVVGFGDGGAIAAFGLAVVKIEGSTVARNQSPQGSEAVFAPTTTTSIIDRSTFSGPQGVVLRGSFDVTSSTFADGDGPVFGLNSGAVTTGSAFSSPTGMCEAPGPVGGPVVQVNSGGFNRTSDASCHLAGTGDAVVASLGLRALADSGGLTQTHLPLVGSPLVDAIPFPTSGSCEAGSTDQRGVARPVGPACDIGAVEGTTSSAT
jgi:hypothetical protein